MQNIKCNRLKKAKAIVLATLLSLLLSMGILLAQSPERSYADTPDVYTARITFKDYGTVTLELSRKAAPVTVDNFVSLAKSGFYNGTTIHRISSSLTLIQGGDPEGLGTGGSGTTIKGEFAANGWSNPIRHERGVISMARGGSYENGFDTASSQFFIMNGTYRGFDGYYAPFGHVTSGLDVLDKIAKAPVIAGTETPVNKPVITSITITDGFSSAGWKTSGSRKWYSYDSVTAKVLGKDFPKNEKILIDGTYYSFDSSGWLKTGWVQEGGKWQYLNSSGLPTNGWIKSGSAWYYVDPNDNFMVSNTKKTIGGETYFFNASGVMRTGWVQDGGKWYYCTGSGSLKTGWLKSGSVWYYLNPSDGVMVANDKKVVDGKTYFFNASGAMRTGWVQVGSTWYHCSGSGAMTTGWLKSGNTWYYLDPSDGAMAANEKKTVGDKMYFFASSGAMRSNCWAQEGNKWYYCGGSGAHATSWVKSGKSWYYMDPSDGTMVSNTSKTIGGKIYFFATSGAMRTGWISQGNDWYYCDGSGAATTGWQKVGGKWYYMDPSTCIMQAGKWVDNDKYFVDESGVYIVPALFPAA